MTPRLAHALTLTAALCAAHPVPAAACGCFAPPDPTQPVLQAGERILFLVDGNTVEAHIQIQFSGRASEFGWLLPLPSVPKLEVGTDELFVKLTALTGPSFNVYTRYPENCASPPSIDAGFLASDLNAFPVDAASRADAAAMDPSPLVVRDSVGPYDYAVLKADSKQAMFDWLKANRYFVPAGTDGAVAQYIHPGAFFLALKLKSGRSSGDLQPVIVRYASDLPMIPIVLTSVTSLRDMPVAVWVLGGGRAIPRNYHHTVINEAAIDWTAPLFSYARLVTRAVGEAPGKHSFVTEYAGPASIMRQQLDYPGRFGDLAALRVEKDAFAYIRVVRSSGYSPSSILFTILQRYLPLPPDVQAAGISPGTFYWNLDFFKQTRFPNLSFPPFDAAKLTADLEAAIVKPTRAAQAPFAKFPQLTYLFTTLSPEDMSRDPVFSFNKDLPAVSNVHQATITLGCPAPDSWTYPILKVVLADGRTIWYRDGQPILNGPLPASQRIETLRDSGPPEVVTDNQKAIDKALTPPSGPQQPPDAGSQPPLSGRGCALQGLSDPTPPVVALLAALLVLAFARRRR